MKKKFWILLSFVLSQFLFAQSEDEGVIRKIYEKALVSGKSEEGLRSLCKEVGSRLSGSLGAENAVRWAEKKMKMEGFDSVTLQEVLVPCWVRGEKEIAQIVGAESLSICALGGSISTGNEGIQAAVLEVQTFQELKELGAEKIKGRIIFFNRPMDAKIVNTFSAYGGAVDQRVNGAKEAAPFGAVAVIVRSMTLALDEVPHTGMMRYTPETKPIPAVAISTKSAEVLSVALKKNPNLQVFLQIHCQTLPEVLSYNVIGEYRGSEFPNEYIVVSGHLDSWDLGEGAHDDGAGCIQAIEVVLLFKSLGIKPKRTILVVLYMNEENGLRGATKYAEQSKEKKEKHCAALESDAGG
ncbi:MAG: M20/M25/M40 family metallo-hydrolase, partial [Planctomycetota bacterium]